jgi:hypothetical protein
MLNCTVSSHASLARVSYIFNVYAVEYISDVEPLAHDGHGLGEQQTARDSRNVTAALMEAVKHGLGQISNASYDVGGEYRRNM